MPRAFAVPFHLKRSNDVFGASSYTSTTETIHGLVCLDGDRLVLQWRVARKTDHYGSEIRSDQELERVREVAVPLSAVAGASVRRRWWEALRPPKLVLTAADLRAFEEVAGEGGLKLRHPAELVVHLHRSDRMLAEEFSAELALAVAELALERQRERRLEEKRDYGGEQALEPPGETDP
jgi:hypothetical protein